MLRWLYIQFIWLHPAPFRWRFGDDMLDDFDRAPNRAKPRFLADAVVSLARQWLLRPEFRHPDAPMATAATLGVPLFQVIEAYKPRPAALLQGSLLAILSIVAAVVVIDKGGGVARPFLIGAHFSRPSLFPIDRSSVSEGGLNTSVEVGPNPSEAWLRLAAPYFGSMPVLRALDSNRDFALSPQEIGNAATAVRSLDTLHSGRVMAEECGLPVDPNSVSPAVLAQLRRQFMSSHPALAALDRNHDGELSTWEIDRAAASLRGLDRNRDGYLSPDELLPPSLAIRAGLR